MGMKGSCSSAFMPRLLYSLVLLLISTGLAANAQDRKKYIVYMGDKPHPSVDAVGTHHRLLSEVLGSHDMAKESIYHSYTQSMNAFAASLTEEEADRLSEMDDVISVFPSKTRKLHTTRTWDFIGFPRNVQRQRTVESNIIVGVLDSGIDPSSASFSDKGYGPPPKKWKGSCGPFANFTCNNKIIGARWYRLDKKIPPKDIRSPLDVGGHGTHTASTIAGGFVPRVNFYGLAGGTARGGVPSARIAVYKVCYNDEVCNDEDILAAFDAAIADGVDIINLSVGEDPGRMFTDTLAVGSYHAMRRGILTSASAGNEGPMHRSIVNYNPWMMTVGASSIDRQFRTDVKLGNGKTISGISINTFEPGTTMYPIIYGSDAAAEFQPLKGARCLPDSLDPDKVSGNIVVCSVTGGSGLADVAVRDAGGVGVIIQISDLQDTAESYILPAVVISTADGAVLSEYYKASSPAKGLITKSYTVNLTAPNVASFSSRGPNPLYKQILKPDLVAPGLNILAAYSSKASFSGNIDDPRRANYALLSGTSMAAPHATAAAAYIKTFHPTWSPAAIKSALMTTATLMNTNSSNSKDNEYSYGSGQINPVRAVDPGLVYDANEASYLQFMCTKYPNITAINILTGTKAFNCAPYSKGRGYDALNYPSFNYLVLDSSQPSSTSFHRSVTNVGTGTSVYKASIQAPAGVEITLVPSTLSFYKPLQTKSFSLKVRTPAFSHRPPYMVSGSLVWSNGVHSVRSPIVVHYT